VAVSFLLVVQLGGTLLQLPDKPWWGLVIQGADQIVRRVLPESPAERAGLRSSILGSTWVMGATVVIAFPIAIGTAIWIEEFAPKNKLTAFVKLNLANLAGVPSIITPFTLDQYAWADLVAKLVVCKLSFATN